MKLLLFLLLSFSSYSQSVISRNGRYEIGMGMGPCFFLGDVGGNRGIGRTFIKDLNISQTTLNKGIYFNYYPYIWVGVRIGLNIGELKGADSIIVAQGGDETDRKERNLDFRTEFNDAYVLLELYPYNVGRVKIYTMFGIGMFHFNPEGSYGNKWVYLRPLRLEGQGMNEYPDRHIYPLTQLEIPLGGGIKYYFSKKLYIGLEFIHRKTFTDYVDDVSTTYINPLLFDKYLSPAQAVIAKVMAYKSHIVRNYIGEQRGNPKNNDSFFSITLRMGMILDHTYEDHIKQTLKCPKYF